MICLYNISPSFVNSLTILVIFICWGTSAVFVERINQYTAYSPPTHTHSSFWLFMQGVENIPCCWFWYHYPSRSQIFKVKNHNSQSGISLYSFAHLVDTWCFKKLLLLLLLLPQEEKEMNLLSGLYKKLTYHLLE